MMEGVTQQDRVNGRKKISKLPHGGFGRAGDGSGPPPRPVSGGGLGEVSAVRPVLDFDAQLERNVLKPKPRAEHRKRTH